MPTITFRDADGNAHAVEGTANESLMQAAVRARIPGIIGECGGELSCATCHVYLPYSASESFPPLSADEEDLLGLVDHFVEGTSRLGCQLSVGDAPEGLTVDVAPQ